MQRINNKNQITKPEAKETQREVSFETEGIHLVELEDREEFNCCCSCKQYNDNASSVEER